MGKKDMKKIIIIINTAYIVYKILERVGVRFYYYINLLADYSLTLDATTAGVRIRLVAAGNVGNK